MSGNQVALTSFSLGQCCLLAAGFRWRPARTTVIVPAVGVSKAPLNLVRTGIQPPTWIYRVSDGL